MENRDKNVSNLSSPVPVPTLRQQAEAIILQKNSALPLDTKGDLPPKQSARCYTNCVSASD